MRKRIYRAVSVKNVNVEQLLSRCEGRLVFGCDAAKSRWFGALMNERSDVLQTVRWDLVDETSDVLNMLESLRQAGHSVDVPIEPTGTYADPLVHALREAEFDVFRVSGQHTKAYQEIYDGVPSGHDAKSAAIVAKLHLERGSRSKRWTELTDDRREVRVAADELDWIKQDERRYLNRLESRLARYWPELTRALALDSVTALRLLDTYGGPAGVSMAQEQAKDAMRRWSRGALSVEKIEYVAASADHTIGVPMTEAEQCQVQHLASTLVALRRERHDAEKELELVTTQQAHLTPIAKMVGVATAGVLFARLGDFRDYESVRSLCRAPGLNLTEHSSGEKKGVLKVSKRGSAVARRWLFLATLRWLRTDAVAKAWYDAKVNQNGQLKLKGVVALMRKLLAALYHIARGKSYDPAKLFDCRRLQLPA